MNTPILLITFNRPEHTRRVLTEILKQEPQSLNVCQDGAREGNENDRIKCQEVRDVISELTSAYAATHPNFSLFTLYSSLNLGCGPGPQAGITCFFKNVEQGIIMEDDCQPHPDILIVDDRCLCMPSFEPQTYDADLVLYSFSEKKQVNLGKGAMSYVGENVRYEECPIPAQSFLTNEEWNLNNQEVLATMDAAIAHKEKLNAIYRMVLPKSIQLPEAYQHWRFNILMPNKDEILKALFDAGLFASSHYRALGEEPAPIASNLSSYVINLFNDSYFTEGQAKKCCEIIRHNIQMV